MTTLPSGDFNYYTNTVYWNDFPEIQAHQNILISGESSLYWPDYLKRKYGKRCRALFPNCGNGWVERDLFQRGVIETADGFDVNPGSIAEAKAAARDIGMPANYFVQDANSFDPGAASYDIVVNLGAMHHVAFIDNMTRNIARALRDGGIYVGMDYVGAHRNQYPWHLWEAMIVFNETIPRKYIKFQRYAHFKTMVATDPTEAIHSELQIETLDRYFHLAEFTPLGGAIAYQILFENRKLLAERQTEEGARAIAKIIEADYALLRKAPEDTLFAFWVGTPQPKVLENDTLLAKWTIAEEEREKSAAANHGRYYPRSALEIIYDEIADLNDALRQRPLSTDL
jgi:SAM-dependent methyltransferase